MRVITQRNSPKTPKKRFVTTIAMLIPSVLIIVLIAIVFRSLFRKQEIGGSKGMQLQIVRCLNSGDSCCFGIY